MPRAKSTGRRLVRNKENRKKENNDLKMSNLQLRNAISKRYETKEFNVWKLLFLLLGLFFFIYGVIDSQIIKLIGGAFLLVFAALLD